MLTLQPNLCLGHIYIQCQHGLFPFIISAFKSQLYCGCHSWILEKLITTYYDVGALCEHLIRGFLLN